METNRFLKIVIIVLLIINIGTLGFIWMQGSHPMGPPHQRESVFDFLVHELKFNEKQVEQYEALRNEHRNMVEDLRSKGRQLHDEYFDLLKSPSADSALVNRLSDSLALNQKQIELITFYHFQKVRGICTAEQQPRFDNIIQEALHIMAPPPHQK